MSFGLCGAPLTFQKTMDTIFKGKKDVLCYLDDIILKSESIKEHYEKVERVNLILKSAGITLNRKKFNFFSTFIEVLRYEVSNGKVKPNTSKLKLIENLKKPPTLIELKSFLSLCSVIRNFVPNFAHRTAD